jgi:hypothetical protein
VSITIVASIVLEGLTARPDVPPVSPVLAWRAPAGCPDAQEVSTMLERHLGRSVDDEGVSAVAQVSATQAGHYRLELEIRVDQATSERSFEHGDCELLAETTALMTAVAIDPSLSAARIEEYGAGDRGEAHRRVPDREAKATAMHWSTAEPSAAAEGDTESSARRRPRPPALPPAVTRAGEPARSCWPGPSTLRQPTQVRRFAPACAALGIKGGLQFGPLPWPSGGIGGHLRVLWPRLAVELGGSHWFKKTVRLPSNPDLGAEVSLTFVIDAALCGRLGWRTLEFPLCAGTQLGQARGKGLGIARPQTDRLLWAAAVLGPRMVWYPHEHIGVVSQLDMLVALTRLRYEVEGLGVVYRTQPVGVRGQVGLEVRFP